MVMSISRTTTGLTLFSLCALHSAVAATPGESGVIHFYGQVVESPCELTSHPQQIAVTCRDPEKSTATTRQMHYEELMQATQPFPHTVSISMHYLDPIKSLALVKLDYH